VFSILSALVPSTLKVLSVGYRPELMWLRDAVLRSAGFDVLTTVDLREGLAHIESGQCGVLLMCYSLPLFSRKRLADSFRANCPQGRIVAITNEKVELEFADASVFGVEGPEALIEAIRNALIDYA
jgi:DNA-binding NarL/FixJ family response regulator